MMDLKGVRAITICQPWAWAIIEGKKRYENRNWPSKIRGPVLIHAGKGRKWLHGIDWMREQGFACPDAKNLTFGAIVGVVQMVDCLPVEECGGDPFASGPWCHVYEGSVRLNEPVPARGALSYWKPTRELIEAVEKQLS